MAVAAPAPPSSSSSSLAAPGLTAASSSPSPGHSPGKTTRIRFLDQLSPTSQRAYHDEQERKKEEKKTKMEEAGESETRIERVEQPSAAVLASQTAENTQYNRHHAPAPAPPPDLVQDTQQPGPPPAPAPDISAPAPVSGESQQQQQPRIVDIQTRYREQELIIQSRMYETQQPAAYLAPDPAQGGGYQNPVFDLEAAGGQGGSAGGGGPEPGWSRVTGRERRPKRWSFRRTNSGRFEHAGRVFPQTSPHSQR